MTVKVLSRAHKGHGLRLAVLGIIAVPLLLVGYVFLSYEFRSIPGAKSVNSVINSFKGGGPDSSTGLRYEPPAQGVYELEGAGSERISFPPNSMSDGSVMPASVTYLSHGCWRWHLDYNTAHWEDYVFCARSDQLVQTSDSNFQAWDFGTVQVTNLATFTCPSSTVVLTGAPVAGKKFAWTCTGTNTSVKGTTVARVTARVVGKVSISVGKVVAEAIHEVQTTTLSGGQKGTVVENWWFSAASGLPLRVGRRIQILTPSPIGNITYSEHGSWQMVSLTPRT